MQIFKKQEDEDGEMRQKKQDALITLCFKHN